MMINDKLYGTFAVQPVIEALIQSKPFQRLKSVHQGGAIFLVDPTLNHTRFEHSIGVYYLVRKLGGSVEEQIAALLHDISHTAFSHVTDYVFKKAGEDYHEAIFDEVINQSGIPSILEQFGFNSAILSSDSYTLLELPLPDLCADRLDYTLRDLFYANRISIDQIHRFLDNLSVYQHQMVVNSADMADWITRQYEVLNEEYFRKKEHVYANTRFADLLSLALTRGIITTADLLGDDFQLLAKLRTDAELRRRLEAIQTREGIEAFVPDEGKVFKQRSLKPTVVS
ncbi:HD domain-containing protein [Larkinella harenae]